MNKPITITATLNPDGEFDVDCLEAIHCLSTRELHDFLQQTVERLNWHLHHVEDWMHWGEVKKFVR